MAYFSNASEGDVLDEQCANCPVGRQSDFPCPVLWVQKEYNYKQFDKEGMRNIVSEVLNELIEDKTGKCRMKYVIEKALNIMPPDAPLHVIPGMEDWAKKHGVKVV